MRGVAHETVLRAKLMARHEQGQTLAELSREFGIARPVLSRWWARYQETDLAGLKPQSRRPHQSPTRLGEAAEWEILRWRRKGWGAARIGAQLGFGQGTVQRVLERAGESRLPHPKRTRPQRYEKQRPGELLHVDIKFLPALRNARWDYEFAAVDDYSREAVAWITTEQTSVHAAQFLEHVVATLPYRIEAVMTDNGLAFSMKHAFHSDRLTRPTGLPEFWHRAQVAAAVRSRVQRQSRAVLSDRGRRVPQHSTAVHTQGTSARLGRVRLVLQSRATASELRRKNPLSKKGGVFRPSAGVTYVLVQHS